MGRHIRTTLQTLLTALSPNWPNPNLVRQNSDTYYNRHHGTRPMPSLSQGDTVRVRTDFDKNWKGSITNTVDTPRRTQCRQNMASTVETGAFRSYAVCQTVFRSTGKSSRDTHRSAYTGGCVIVSG
ncbi:hypothetical protein LSAT2_029601 [Lamellibrachia satsuma]|nr:hypothetical protein LSAT2_029601 [Lamellibrachia satsuma]